MHLRKLPMFKLRKNKLLKNRLKRHQRYLRLLKKKLLLYLNQLKKKCQLYLSLLRNKQKLNPQKRWLINRKLQRKLHQLKLRIKRNKIPQQKSNLLKQRKNLSQLRNKHLWLKHQPQKLKFLMLNNQRRKLQLQKFSLLL